MNFQLLNIDQNKLEEIIERCVIAALEKREEMKRKDPFEDLPDFLNRSQVSELLDVHVNYINRLAEGGAFSRIRTSKKKSVYPKAEVQAYYNSQKK